MKNKKLLALLSLLVAISMLGASLTACSSKSKKSDKKKSKVEDEEDEDDEDDDDEDDDDEDDEDDEDDDEDDDDEDDDDDDDFDDDDDDDFDDDDDDNGNKSKGGSFTINEDVIYDADDIKITVSDTTYDDWYGTQIELLIENNTDEDLEFHAKDVFVNGCYDSTYLSDGSVSAGKKTYAKLSLRDDEMATSYNIKSFETIDFVLYATNSNWDYVIDDEPISMTTDLKGDKPSFDETVVIYDADGVYISAKFEPSKDDYSYNQIFVYCENNTDKEYSFSVDALDVNGFTLSGYMYVTLPGGRVGVGTISLYDSDLEENHIDEIEDIELSISVQNYDDWKDKFTTDSVEIPV